MLIDDGVVMKSKKQPTSYMRGRDVADVLSVFQFDGKECRLLHYQDEAIDVEGICFDSGALTEICRFEVDGRRCLIVQKASPQEGCEPNLGALLSTRELQIATLVAMGCLNKQVADRLHISEWTVATYLRRIFAKLGVDTRAAMTYRCASLIKSNTRFPSRAV
jgi:DNA-binding CsgD family transcriptional regulator